MLLCLRRHLSVNLPTSLAMLRRINHSLWRRTIHACRSSSVPLAMPYPLVLGFGGVCRDINETDFCQSFGNALDCTLMVLRRPCERPMHISVAPGIRLEAGPTCSSTSIVAATSSFTSLRGSWPGSGASASVPPTVEIPCEDNVRS
jgi:hypothetical protein